MSLLNEKDNNKSIVNLLLMISILVGFTLFGYAIYARVDAAFIPLGTVIAAAVSALGVKAYKGTS